MPLYSITFYGIDFSALHLNTGEKRKYLSIKHWNIQLLLGREEEFIFSRFEHFLLLWTVFWVIFIHVFAICLFSFALQSRRQGLLYQKTGSTDNALQGDCGFHMRLPKLYWLIPVGLIHKTSCLISPDQIFKCWIMGFALFHNPEILFLTKQH